MNHNPQNLPVFPWLASFAGFACLAAVLVAFISAGVADEPQPPAASPDESKDAAKTAEGAAAPGPPDAQRPPDTQGQAGVTEQPQDAAELPVADEILSQVRSRLEGLDSLKCELHQTSMISGMKLTAFGRYVEAGGNKVRLEYFIFPMVNSRADDAKSLALDAAPQTVDEAESRGVLTQISDGIVLHTSWKNGDTQRVTRRNIRDILAAASATTAYDPKNAAMDLGIGGLRGLIARLQTTMEFAVVKSVKVGDRDFFEVTGRWSEKIRKDLFKLPEGTVIDPRPQIPEYVRVYADSETMLPRRIQFLKRSMDPTQKMVRPLITLDLRNLVINEPVDDTVFTFSAPENTVESDMTEQVIQMIQASVQPPATGASTPSPVGVPEKQSKETPK